MAWIIGLLFAMWVATAYYIVIIEALETAETRVHFTAALQERDLQLELKEKLEAEARAFGLEIGGAPAPEEVLAPSREAYLKEFWRMQRFIRPGESIASYPSAAEEFSSSREPSIPTEKAFDAPLEAWKALFGLTRKF